MVLTEDLLAKMLGAGSRVAVTVGERTWHADAPALQSGSIVVNVPEDLGAGREDGALERIGVLAESRGLMVLFASEGRMVSEIPPILAIRLPETVTVRKKRIQPRVPDRSTVYLSIKCADGAVLYEPAQTQDLSTGGMRVVAPISLERHTRIGDTLHYALRMLDGESVLRGVATIMHAGTVEQPNGSLFSLGLRFDGLSSAETARLDRYVQVRQLLQRGPGVG